MPATSTRKTAATVPEAAARFSTGDAVRVANGAVFGHVRTPQYVRGKIGTVERICGRFRAPEELSRGKYDGAQRALYRVRFLQVEVWPDYHGDPSDTLDVEIYEHWLEPVRTKR
ncbi:MAG: nitrile hydratase subunit beta [Candidatus Eremiobacteraeota bacterium]|nr:nitrile hydratase subunit beta [Candidatus Eremiobacteraeota bacterium]